MAEHVVRVDGVELCSEALGDPTHPPVLLVMGAGASMIHWDEGFCRLLAAGGRFVIRYDHRDTGRSTCYPPGHPGYTGADLVADAVRVLDGHRIGAAHLVGVSAGGALVQLLALRHPERACSLTLISTTAALPGGGELPPPTEEFLRYVTSAPTAGADPQAAVEQQVDHARVLSGGRRPFDEAAARSLARRDAERARDLAAARNHDALPDGDLPTAPLSSITAPTLVIHGSADPMFPLPHGAALARRIPGARLLTLPDAGHGLEPADRSTVATAIIDHTAPGRSGPGRSSPP
ncbi:alpha/beta hydrolase [Kitasatospora sp. NPDC094015]|uniref:alpha/beta fold hydrolase n=1 Tax=Kitasatospora sp. NPDC094015 TaxID=3155205 RepID=UPI00333099C5